MCENEFAADSATGTVVDVSPAAQAVKAEEETYGEILKSSALVGGSSVANIAIGIVRTKAMAILLGPSGYGLFGLYGSILNVTQIIADMGVNSSGVRQIAAAVGSGDEQRIALTTVVLRRTSIVLGLIGAALLAVGSKQISRLTFGTTEHTMAVCLLSVAVFFQLVSWGQNALIQGLRRIADLAKMQVLGALIGAVVSIVLVYFWRDRGVVPSLVVVALMYLVVSWRFSRKVRVKLPSVSVSEVGREASALLKLGVAFMMGAFMTMGVAYAVRIMVLRMIGFAATGYYQSAWTLGGLYVGFILQAMAADFYPRLTASADNNPVCNRLVNEQTQVGLLLAGPGILGTLTFTPLVIGIFYSAKFLAAVNVLRWICVGTILQVIAWPLSYIIVSKGKQLLFFFTEVSWALASVALAWFCIRRFGLDGAGIAFFGSYVFYLFMLYGIVRQLSGFRWSSRNLRLGLFFLPLIALVFCGFSFLHLWVAIALGISITVMTGLYSLRVLSSFANWDDVPKPIQRLILPLRSIFRRLAILGG